MATAKKSTTRKKKPAPENGVVEHIPEDLLPPVETEREYVDSDWLPDTGGHDLSELVKAVFSTDVGKDRKAVITKRQAVALAKARIAAVVFDLPEVTALCDYLQDNSVSVNGLGLKQLVQVLSARMTAQDESSVDKLKDRLFR